MASVNLTCSVCSADHPCDRCAACTRALRAAGHCITQSSRYDALRAAAVGTYGFDACVLPVARHEPALIDAASALLARTRVALLVEPGAPGVAALPEAFTVIETADWHGLTFPTDWVASTAATPPEPDHDTRVFAELSVPAADDTDVELARRRLKGMARRVQRELGAAGFPEDAKLDLLATLEDEIAWAKMSGVCFGLVLIHVAKKDGSSKADGMERLLGALGQHVERVVRASDIVTQGSDSVAVIVAEAAADQTGVATSRIKKAVRKALKEAAVLSSTVGRVTLGIAVYPTHGTTRAALLARAAASSSQG